MKVISYIDREIVLNDLARYLADDIEEPHIISDNRLRKMAYRCRAPSIDVTPTMDAEILLRVKRLLAARAGRHQPGT